MLVNVEAVRSDVHFPGVDLRRSRLEAHQCDWTSSTLDADPTDRRLLSSKSSLDRILDTASRQVPLARRKSKRRKLSRLWSARASKSWPLCAHLTVNQEANGHPLGDQSISTVLVTSDTLNSPLTPSQRMTDTSLAPTLRSSVCTFNFQLLTFHLPICVHQCSSVATTGFRVVARRSS